jgi:hypothetical protein
VGAAESNEQKRPRGDKSECQMQTANSNISRESSV